MKYFQYGPPQILLAVTIATLFLPQLALAIFATLNFLDKNSLKIITNHPSLLLLPTFTFFTFSKARLSCSEDQSHLALSDNLSCLNILLSSLGDTGWLFWVGLTFGLHDYYSVSLTSTLSPLLLSIILTGLFFQIGRNIEQEISVFDPSTDQRLILRDGKLVKPDERRQDSPSNLVEGSKMYPR